MSAFLQQLMAEIFEAQDVGKEKASQLAKLAIETLEAVDVAPMASVQRFETDAKIYHLRGKGLRPCDLSIRFQLTRQAIFFAIRRHGQHRREALRLGHGMVA